MDDDLILEALTNTENLLRGRLQIIERDLGLVVTFERGEQLIRERNDLQLKLQAARLCQENTRAMGDAREVGETHRGRITTLHERANTIRHELENLEEQQRKLVEEGKQERPDLGEMVWAVPAVRQHGAAKRQLQEELLTIEGQLLELEGVKYERQVAIG